MTKCTEAAARETAYVGALKTARAAFNSIEDKSPDSWWDRAAWMRKEIDDALADTSPAAAALLAQGNEIAALRTELLELVEGEDTTLADQIRDLVLNLDEGALSGEAKE